MHQHARISARSRMTSKGQVTIPKDVRDSLGLKDGVQIDWVAEGGVLTGRPRKLRAVDLAGFLGPSPVGPLTIKEMNEGIAAAVAERFERSSK